ncbi:DUF1622 domain-containing protein [Synechococcus sp. CCY9201]|uniref:DUF1622 domain-containing protein n=1 Tax=Synechococcus sp. CCY9201 TaxID=174697 RepID=UPI002B1FB003|nr:DUF1622 domain-containing protein [Synechococcus sp. CCY9201]MEA5474464.1 DUF1622 domain-containing protein [Synechococcus sp. CCY9201]
MALTTLMEMGMNQIAETLRLCLEFLSVLCVATGLVITLLQGFWPQGFWPQGCRHRVKRRQDQRSLNRARLTFGSWLSLALECQLGADIVATTTAPSKQNLIQLASIAVIRTFLNIFLARELEAEQTFEDNTTKLATVLGQESK